MDVLVVGGTGLISTGITAQLVERGHDVTLFNRGESERTDAVPDDLRHVEGDRYDYDAFEARMAGESFDCVVDVLCFDEEDAASAVRAFGGRVEQFVVCSTVDVYRRPAPEMPVVEAAERAPVTDYAAGKIAVEDRLLAADGDAFATTVLRPWHTYGEAATGNVSGTLDDAPYLDRLRRGLPLVVHGDGTSMWGSCHRDDVARAFANAVGNEAAYGEAYHVTGEATTWNQYHERAAAALGAPDPELVHVPTELLVEALPGRTGGLAAHYRYSTVFDDAKARRDLDFETTVDFGAGVERTVAWLDERDRIPDAGTDPEYDRVVEAWRSAGEGFVETLR